MNTHTKEPGKNAKKYSKKRGRAERAKGEAGGNDQRERKRGERAEERRGERTPRSSESRTAETCPNPERQRTEGEGPHRKRRATNLAIDGSQQTTARQRRLPNKRNLQNARNSWINRYNKPFGVANLLPYYCTANDTTKIPHFQLYFMPI